MEILSGVFEGMSTGAPICLQIKNIDQKSKDYSNIANAFRPGHADITYQKKYGVRDFRGGADKVLVRQPFVLQQVQLQKKYFMRNMV